jgi:hypothetical protein
MTGVIAGLDSLNGGCSRHEYARAAVLDLIDDEERRVSVWSIGHRRDVYRT